jgi:hypothetical protein
MSKKTRRQSKYNYVYKEPTPSYYHNSPFNIEIKNSNIKEAGLGVFTNEPIRANTMIDGYTGEYRSRCFSRYYFLIREGLGIDALDYPRCYMGMLNDSYGSNYSNNCKFVVDLEGETVGVWSTRDISAGEELFVSYGSDYWSQ